MLIKQATNNKKVLLKVEYFPAVEGEIQKAIKIFNNK